MWQPGSEEFQVAEEGHGERRVQVLLGDPWQPLQRVFSPLPSRLLLAPIIKGLKSSWELAELSTKLLAFSQPVF